MRRTALLLIVPMVLICSAGAQNARVSNANEPVARGQKLKNLLSPQAQRNLSLAEQKFNTDISGRKALSSSELRLLAQSAIRGRFPRATSGELNSLAAILLSDWVTSERSRIQRLQTKAQGQSIGDDTQLAYDDLRNTLQNVQQAVQTISDISKMMQDKEESIIRNMKD
jgi:hypothetical protein